MKPTRPLPLADSDCLSPDTRAIDQLFAEIYAEHADTIAAVIEDRAETLGSLSKPAAAGEPDPVRSPVIGESVILIQDLLLTGNKDRVANKKPYELLKFPVSLITRGNPGKHFDALANGRPHLRSVIGTLLNDLAAREAIRLRPTILVGPAGCGKTTLARAIGAQLGLPSVVYPAAGVADGTFGGTSAHWSNTAPSVVVQMLHQHMIANPLIIVDEIDKSTQGSHNGSLKDVLLGFLDRGNASVFRDPSLETVVDCSHVNWILTANDIGSIPGPLKDRCRVIQVPDPEWRHVGEVTRSILDGIAVERDLDRRWLPDLDGDEIALIKRHWNGGSIRRLRRIVETIVDVRDQHLPSA